MAIWQVSFYLEMIDEQILLDEDQFCRSLNILGEFMEKEKSWSDSCLQFGKNDSTCVEIFFEDNIIDEIFVRIDVRNISVQIIKCISDFAKHNKLYIKYDNMVCEACQEKILEIVISSDAYKYLLNPEFFLKNRKNKT